MNPNATPQARNLLCYLYEVNGSGVLSGQQETSWNPNPSDDVNWYNSNFGVYPAVLGGDYLYPDGTTQRAIAYWNAGGITMIRYHMGAPPLSDTYENSQGTANIANVLQPGTGESDSFYSKLDYISDELQQLEDANVAVLWAPFHEFQPNGWFWWSKGTDAQFHQLWQNMFDYLTETKGLDNLVWLAPSSGSPNGSWYPDKATYDVGGPDTYATDPPFASMYTQARGILGTSVPITLHETGTVVQPDTMFPSTAPWVLFNVWAGYYNDGQHNSTSSMQSAYASEYTITRDEVPNLNSTLPRIRPNKALAAAPAKHREVDREGPAPTSAAPERARIVVKSLVGLRRFHEARDEARRMLAAYPSTPEALDVERHLLVYPLDQPSREQMQAEMQGDPAQ